MNFSDRSNVQDVLGLTPMQQAMLARHVLEGGEGVNFEQTTLILEGNIESGKFLAAWETVSRRNEMLRASFSWEKTHTPVMIIWKTFPLEIEFMDIAGLAAKEQETALEGYREANRRRGFDLRRPPFRIALHRLAPKRSAMTMSHHHILFDGWSCGVLFHELLLAYEDSQAAGSVSSRIIPKTPYKEYVKYIRGEAPDSVRPDGIHNETLEGWREFLAKNGREFNGKTFPKINKNADWGLEREVGAGAFGHMAVPVGDGLKESLLTLSRSLKISLSSILYGAWSVLLQHWLDVPWVIFDTTVSGRNIPVRNVENMVGLFINTVPLLVAPDVEQTVRDFLAAVQRRLLARTGFENLPPALLREAVTALCPAFPVDSLVVVENYPLAERLKEDNNRENEQRLRITDFHFQETAGYDLTVLANLLTRWEIRFSCRLSLFTVHWLEGIASMFLRLLETMAANPNQNLKDIYMDIPGEGGPAFLTGNEKAANGWNITERGVYAAPETEMERRLVQIWGEVLKKDPAGIGVMDHFFKSGGHSLHVLLLSARIQKEFQVLAPLTALFRYPTVREFARFCSPVEEKEMCPPVSPAPELPSYPLSPTQKRMYFLQLFDSGSTAYNIPVVFRIRGAFDRGKAEEVFQELTKRHESLRTSFFMEGDEPRQRIHDHVQFSLDYLRFQKSSEGAADFPDELLLSLVQTFSLDKPPLMRATLIRLDHEDHLLFFDIHHIVSDGTSAALLIREFSTLWRGEISKEPRVHYRDYVCWLESPIQLEQKRKSAVFWKEVYKESFARTLLPYDFPRPEGGTVQGRRLEFMLPRSLQLGLNRLAEQAGCTLFTVLFSAYGLMLYRLGGGDDIITGVPAAGRSHADLQEIVGMFVNTLAVRVRPRSELTFREFLADAGNTLAASLLHQDYPLEELAVELNVSGEVGRNPLFDSMFALNNMETGVFHLPGLSVEPWPFRPQTAKMDLTFGLMETGDGVSCHLEFNGDLFLEETIRGLFATYATICEAAVFNWETRLGDFPLMSRSDRERLLFTLNDTVRPFPEEKGLHQLFLEQAARTPDAIAAIRSQAMTAASHPDQREDLYMSYGELERRSRHIAKLLFLKGVQAGDIVALSAAGSLAGISAILAILRVGAAYLPVDPGFPEDRIRLILDDSGAPVLVLDEFSNPLLGNDVFPGVRILQLEPDFSTIPASGASAVVMNNTDNTVEEKNDSETIPGKTFLGGEPANDGGVAGSPAYIIYTSGSSGKPKGVVVEHKSAVNVVTSFVNTYDVNPRDRILRQASLAFDVSVNEIFPVLSAGGAITIPDPNAAADFAMLLSIMRRHRISIFAAAPSLLSRLNALSFRLPHLRLILSGGESLGYAHVDRLLDQATIVNGYGPTETTICACCHHLDREKLSRGESIPIGKPLMNYRFYVLDPLLRLVPPGFKGELCIGGSGVARGYLNRPELTAEKFLETQEYGRIYRSGDRVRIRPNGDVEFLGRLDDQVKIRGYRIEPAEVEKKLLENPEVCEAVAAVRQYENGEYYLCAWVKSQPGTGSAGLSPNRLRDYLAGSLPPYMIPSFIVTMDAMPLNTSGKIDRRRLPSPHLLGDEELVPPRNAQERRLAELFARILGIGAEKVGVNQNFFRLGGHSLKAAALAAAISDEFRVPVPVRDVFARPTVAALSDLLFSRPALTDSTVPVMSSSETKEYYPVSPAQERILAAQRLEPRGTAYNMTFAAVLTGPLDKEKLNTAFASLVENHESLRTSFHTVNGQNVQRIAPFTGFRVEILENSGTRELDALIRDFIRPFDLSTAPLIRARIISLELNRHLLLTDMHHAIGDGVSAALLLQQLSRVYRSEPLRPPIFAYRDYAVYLKSPAFTALLKEQETWWRRFLEAAEPDAGWPADYYKTQWNPGEGGLFRFSPTPEETLRLRQLAGDSGCTLFSVLLSVYNLLFHKISGAFDVIVGIPASGRETPGTADIIGMFVNTLPVRSRMNGEMRFSRFLEETASVIRDVVQHQDYSLENMMAFFPGQGPLFRTFFSFQAAGGENLQLPGVSVEPIPVPAGDVKFDITLEAEETPEGLSCRLYYRSGLFKESTMERLANGFRMLAKQVAANPEARLQDLEWVTPHERQRILYDFNCNNTTPEPPATIHGLFRKQARNNPDNPALFSPGEKNGRVEDVSYGELDACSDLAAGGLLKRGVKPGSIVAVWTERSVETIIGILGILKAGAAYLPLHPNCPPDQAKRMIADASACLTLRKQDIMKLLGDAGHDAASILAGLGAVSFPAPAGLRAYVMYTSGSTGNPRGVSISHDNVVHLVRWFGKRCHLTPGRRIAQMTSCTFDPSVEQIFGALLHGAAVCLIPETFMTDLSRLRDYIQRQEIDTVNFTPSFLDGLLGSGPRLPRLETVISGGEALPAELRDRLLDLGYRVFNHYGPTETTVDATAGECLSRIPGETATIGKPIDNVRCYILDPFMNPVSIGVPGELYIGGAGVSAGYLNDPETTAERFVQNPFHNQPDPVLFKTGDRAAWTETGEIRWLGRLDNQIKLRGCRIELEGIENALAGYPGASRVAAALLTVPGEDGKNFQALCAYVSPKPGLTLSPETLRDYMSLRLPAHMVPAFYMILQDWPQTPGGKTDRRRLPEPDWNVILSGESPRDAIEQGIAEIMKDIFSARIREIPMDASFFQLGGDSLGAVALAVRLSEMFHMDLPVAAIYKSPTVRALASYVRSRTPMSSPEAPDVSPLFSPVSDPGEHRANRRNETNPLRNADASLVLLKETPETDRTLFLVHDGGGGVEAYIDFCRCLDSPFNCWGLQAAFPVGDAPLSIRQLASRYLSAVRAVQEHGPYYIAGWSLGGVIAFEMARALEKAGETIAFFGMIDSFKRPNAHRETHSGDDINHFRFTETESADFQSQLEKLIPGYQNLHPNQINRRLQLLRMLNQAWRRYQPTGKIHAPVFYFKAAQSGDQSLSSGYWRRFAGNLFSAIQVEGDHYTMFRTPFVLRFAQTFAGVLRERSCDC